MVRQALWGARRSVCSSRSALGSAHVAPSLAMSAVRPTHHDIARRVDSAASAFVATIDDMDAGRHADEVPVVRGQEPTNAA